MLREAKKPYQSATCCQNVLVYASIFGAPPKFIESLGWFKFLFHQIWGSAVKSSLKPPPPEKDRTVDSVPDGGEERVVVVGFHCCIFVGWLLSIQ